MWGHTKNKEKHSSSFALLSNHLRSQEWDEEMTRNQFKENLKGDDGVFAFYCFWHNLWTLDHQNQIQGLQFGMWLHLLLSREVLLKREDIFISQEHRRKRRYSVESTEMEVRKANKSEVCVCWEGSPHFDNSFR